MYATHTLTRIIAGMLLSGGVAVAGFGLWAGVAQADPTCPDSPVFLLVPGKTPTQVGCAYHLGYECLPQLSL